MKRNLFLLYGIVCYLTFLATYAYFIAFAGGFTIPKSVDSGTGSPTLVALSINLLLISLFAFQHSVMARPAFKRRWTRIIPRPVERSTYVLFSSLVLMVVMWQWQPLSGQIWTVDNEIIRAGLHSLFALGVVVAIGASFMINHPELLGLQQVYQYWRRNAITSPEFQTPWFYKIVRHPIQSGQILFFWAAPDMTIGRLVLALGMTAYALVGIYFEERDLMRVIGPRYTEYLWQVPRLIPSWKMLKANKSRSKVYSG